MAIFKDLENRVKKGPKNVPIFCHFFLVDQIPEDFWKMWKTDRIGEIGGDFWDFDKKGRSIVISEDFTKWDEIWWKSKKRTQKLRFDKNELEDGVAICEHFNTNYIDFMIHELLSILFLKRRYKSHFPSEMHHFIFLQPHFH